MEGPKKKPFIETVKKAGAHINEELRQPMPPMSRRTFLGAMGASVLVGGLAGKKLSGPDAEEKSPEELTVAGEKLEEREAQPKLYDMGPLAGRKVADLFAFYIGVPEKTTIPEKLSIDFYQVLRNLWDKKIERVRKHQPDWAANTRRAANEFLVPYAEHEKGEDSFHELLGRMDNIIEEIRGHLDWQGIANIKAPHEANFTHLTPEDAALIEKLSHKVTGRMLAAYSITELMPALKDYKINVDMYAFLLKNAGSGFLRSIPALYDNYLSTGLFQFTSFAVYDDGKEQRGASVINKLLPSDKRIPGSVVALTSEEDQVKAAYLFAVFNIAQLVTNIRAGSDPHKTAQRMSVLNQHADSLTAGLLQYIASAHHNPSAARAAFKKWTDADLKGSHADLASPHIAGYIRKSHGNYYELEKHPA